MALAAIGIALNIIDANTTSSLPSLGVFIALLSFLLLALCCTAGQVVLGMEISLNRLVGAVSLYLLLGVIWAVMYTLIEMLVPGSFGAFTPTIGEGWDSDWLYFSFVTMTTLGYGDITPVSAMARALAYMQALFGQFYIAILVAGLVSAYITERQSSGKS